MCTFPAQKAEAPAARAHAQDSASPEGRCLCARHRQRGPPPLPPPDQSHEISYTTVCSMPPAIAPGSQIAIDYRLDLRGVSGLPPGASAGGMEQTVVYEISCD